jgi:hypothetical protein
MADEASVNAGSSAGATAGQLQDVLLQGIEAGGVLGGLPVAERNQEFFLVFRGIGGTGPEILEQTAFFIEYLVDSDGNVFKPSENTSALNNLIQNFPVNKQVSVIADDPSGENSIMAGIQKLTAVGLQQPILYTQTGKGSNQFTGSIFFKTDPQSGFTDNDGSLVSPNMQAFMIKSSSISPGEGTNFNNQTGFDGFVDGVPLFTAGNARSASLNNGRYFVTTSAFGDLQSVTFTANVRVQNLAFATTNPSVRVKITKGSSVYSKVIAEKNVHLPQGNPFFQQITVTGSIVSPFEQPEPNPLSPTPAQPIENGDDFRMWLSVSNEDHVNISFIEFGVKANDQNPVATSSLLQDSNNNAPPFWTTSSGNHPNNFYLTASDYLSSNYNRIQVSTGSSPSGVEIGSQFKDYNLSKIRVPFNINIGDRIRFLSNKSLDFHIYDVKEPNDEVDGKLKIKVNQQLSQSLSENNLSNFVLHRTNKSIPRYVILDVDKEPGVGSADNPFTGIILPQFPTEKLINNLDTILNKLKVEGILEN